ncbi:MAG TPA: hypothetical protein V6D22_21760 [Candidatus Obscuribacterales bacterium]
MKSGRTVRRRGAALAEFGPVLWMFLILFVIPFLDLISFGSAMGTIMYVASSGARAAAGAMTFTDAQKSVAAMEAQMKPFLAFAKTTPITKGANGGFSASASGISVVVAVTPVDGSSAPGSSPYSKPGNIPNTTPDPNDANPPKYNTTNCVYQYVVTCSYDVLPLFNFQSTPLPVLQSVPLLGQPVPVVYSATSSVEHPEGLNN